MGADAALIIAGAGVAAGVFAQQQAARRARRQRQQLDAIMPDRHASRPGVRMTPRQRVLRQAEEELRQIRHETAMAALAAYPPPMTATEVMLRQRESIEQIRNDLNEVFVEQFTAEIRAFLGLRPDPGIGMAAPAREQLQGIAPPMVIEDIPEEILRHIELRPGQVFTYRGEEIRLRPAVSNDEAMAAEKRAKYLLFQSLTDEQKKSWTTKDYFLVEGNVSRRWYKIKPGRQGNISDGRGHDYCITAQDFLPMSDIVLSQKLIIEGDENTFLAIARKSRMRPDDFSARVRWHRQIFPRDG